MRQKSNKERYNFLIDKTVYKEFSKFCDERGLVRSKQIELMMRKMLENEK